MKLRVLAFALAILAFFIFVGSPFQQAANAVVGVDDALIAIIIAALAALGITFVTTAAYNSLEDYVGSLLTEYASDNNTTVNGLFFGVQTGTTKFGKIVVNNKFVLLIQGFAAWLKVKLNLIDHDIQNLVVPGSTVAGLTAYSLPFEIMNEVWGRKWDIFIGNGAYIIWGSSTSGRLLNANFYSETSCTVQRVTIRSNGTVDNPTNFELTYSDTLGLYTARDNSNFAVADYSQLQSVTYYSDDYLNSLEDAVIDNNNIGIDVVTGNIVLPSDNLDYSEGDGAIIDVGADWGASYDDVTDGVIPGEFSNGKEGDASIEYTSEEAAQDQVEDTPAEQVSQNVSEYQVTGLTTVFPFCIPFDLYNFVACLAADPVAPSFTWRFYVPGICDETLEIDLSEFDAAAQILRTMELLLFCVGLAFVTRKIIRG